MSASPSAVLYEPLVSVVMPTYNGEKFIAEAIESILRQTYRNFEIIVIDDGSTDGTAAVVASFGDAVRYFKQANGGVPAARNVGMGYARGELIALLDHDDRWVPQKLERQVPLFARNPNLGMAHAGVRFFRDSDGVVTSEHPAQPDIGFHDLLGFETLVTQTMTFPRSLALELGGFDASLPGCDDWDFCIRVAAVRAVEGVPEILAEVRGHPNQAGGRQDRIYRLGMRLIEKNGHFHKNCRDCARAIRRSKKKLHNIHYLYLNNRARQRFREGSLWTGAVTALHAFRHEPIAVLRVPVRFARRCLGRA